MAGEYCMNTFKKNSQNERSSQTWDNKQIQSSTGWWSNLCIYFSFVALYHSAEVATSVTKIDHPCCQYPMTWMVDKTSRVRWHFPMTQVSSLSHPSLRSPTFRDGVSFVFPRTWKLLTFDRSTLLTRNPRLFGALPGVAGNPPKPSAISNPAFPGFLTMRIHPIIRIPARLGE